MHKTCLEPNREKGIAGRIIWAAQDAAPVSGLTHSFYRYPVRFSPVFVRSVIEAFSDPGDWVIDPFAGGGTTLVEAMALGRNALGIDISSLSAFICEAKTLVMSDQDIAAFERWRSRLSEIINMRQPGVRFESYAEAGYYRNIEGREFWRLRKAVNGGAKLVHPGGAKLVHLTLCGTRCWGGCPGSP